jgi:deazaflavin-dependent oxidoreductase (nitroreductase family)
VANSSSGARYVEPGWFTRNVFNRLITLMTNVGVSVWGSRTLWVRGRVSSEWRCTPVNVLAIGSDRYLVAPRGETQWVRNLRVAQVGELRLGRSREVFQAVEINDAEKAEVLRAYLKRWKMEVGIFFDGVSATSSDDDVNRVAPNHPVFRITT